LGEFILDCTGEEGRLDATSSDGADDLAFGCSRI